MNKIKLIMLATVLAVCPASMCGMTTHAKVTVIANSSHGKVYINKAGDKENDLTKAEATAQNHSPKEQENVKFKAFAISSFTGNEGWVFDHWEDTKAVEDKEPNTNPYNMEYYANSTISEEPEEYTLNAIYSHAKKSDVVINNMYMSSIGIGTFVSPFVTVIPKYCKAYTVNYFDENTNTITFTEIANAGWALEPYTPAIIVGTSTKCPTGNIAQSVGLKKNINANKKSDGDYLKGVYNADETIPVGAYVLQVIDGEVYFNEITKKLPATQYRCYLKLPSTTKTSNARLRAVFIDTTPNEDEEEEGFNNETTAVEDVQTQTNSSDKAIYSLTGEKQNSIKAGINIIRENGKVKKVIK